MRPAIDEQDFLNNFSDWADYKQRAEAFAQSALIEQRGEDLQILLHMYAPPDVVVLRPQLKLRDNVTFLALFEIAQQRGLPLSVSMIAAADTAKQSLTSKEQEELLKKHRLLDKGFTGPMGDDVRDSFLISDNDEFCR
jgi:hypothetical protein